MYKKNYYSLKKHRELKKRISNQVCSDSVLVNDQDDVPNDQNVTSENINRDIIFVNSDGFDDTLVNKAGKVAVENLAVEEKSIEDINSCSSPSPTTPDAECNAIDMPEDFNHQEIGVSLRQKLHEWAVENLASLQINVITKLHVILRAEGHDDRPKTGQTLLGTVHVRKTQVMKSRNGNDGEYIYLGIESSLKKQIELKVYTEPGISVLIHIDGLQVNKSTSNVIWPIVMKIQHKSYISQPVAIALYYGDSKPASLDDYLKDFIQEANQLVQTGVKIDNQVYSFEIMAIIADAQARSYIKCCESAGGFWACERCTVKGQSAGEGRKKTRIYPDFDAKKRDKRSFITKEQQQHHLPHCESPLISLIDFDPINEVVLDQMHLLYCRAMARLLNYWLITCNPAKLKAYDRIKLKTLFKNLKNDIPMEFQRKIYDTTMLAQWKATMYRFVLLYCGPVILKGVLPETQYRHFLLLSLASRLLNNEELAVQSADYAKKLLIIFFQLLPHFYGIKSQVLSMHNLLHIADDVLNFNMSLVDFSAFWGESYIGLFRKLIKSPRKQLVQVINRLNEMERDRRTQIKKCSSSVKIKLSHGIFQYNGEKFSVVSRITLAAYTLTTNHPDNVVLLENGKIYKISKIFVQQENMSNQLKDIFILGYEGYSDNLFNYPSNSTDFGIYKIKKFSNISSVILLFINNYT